ncbi:MAG: AraC family transcriptional regulator ligand-binding domain-containing protein [Thermodesulfobacteriota bacterium]
METANKIIRPIAGVFPYLRFASDKGVEIDAVLNETGLTESDCFDPQNEIRLSVELSIVRNLVDRLPAPETVWELGRYFYSRSHGVLGKMMETAPTLGDVFACWVEFSMLLHVYYRIHLETSGKKIRMYAENLFDLPEDLAPILMERDIIAGKTAVDARKLGTFRQNASAISLKHSPRTDITRYREFFLDNILFNQKENYVEIEKSSLSVSLPDANPHKYELLRQQCQTELALRKDSRLFTTDSVTLHFQVNKGNISFSDIAGKMNMSERTLRLKLSNEGTSFRKIRNQYVFQQSIHLLNDPGITIEEISDALGYSETCAFSRAFEKISGTTPGKYRKKLFAIKPI